MHSVPTAGLSVVHRQFLTAKPLSFKSLSLNGPRFTRRARLPPVSALSSQPAGSIMGAVFSLLGDAAGMASKALRNGPLVAAVGIPLTLGTIVGFSTLPQVFTWYQKLNKPKWCPPAPLFGQTWSLLYGLMGYASYLVWQQTGWPSQPLTVYAVQLGLNLAWQLMFFIGHKTKAALVENTVLLGAVAYTTYVFWGVDPRAGQLMLPYLAFNGFAVALNKAFVDRNPQLDTNPDLKSAGPKVKPA